MVEFGLKLEDNRVDDWADKYIDYEKLKAVLKRAKASAANRDDLIKRLPSAAAEVTQERKDRLAMGCKLANQPNLPPPDYKGLMIPLKEDSDERKPLNSEVDYPLDKRDSSSSLPVLKNDATDTTPLLSDPNKRMVRVGGSWGKNLNQTVFKVTSYFGLADDSILLNKAYDDADEKLDLFKEKYEQEVKKVRAFYQEKTDEISQRMEVLVESVDASGLQVKKSKQPKNRVEWLTEKFEAMMQGDAIENFRGSGHNRSGSASEFAESLEDDDEDPHHLPGDNLKKEQKVENVRKSDSIRRAITDIYRTSKLLHNFAIMNYTGFVKIAKKFDKTFPEHKGAFKGSICDDGKQAEVLTAKMERMYSKWFCDGDIREAQAQMLPKKGDGLLMDWTQLRLGYRLGMCSILALWIAWDCVWGQISHSQVSIGGRSAFPVFRGVFGLVVWHWCWGLSVYVWNRYRINYIYLFEFDPRYVDTPVDIFNDAVDETLVFLICMLMYYKADTGNMPLWIPPRAYPSLLILYTLKCLFFPWKMRRPLWIAIGQVVSAPFVSPTFFLTYVGDVFTSMVKVFQDILWTFCFFATGDFLTPEIKNEHIHVHAWTRNFWYKNIAIPLVCIFPLWLRFTQCLCRYLETGKRLPNLGNAFKYAMSLSVSLFGAFHPLVRALD